MKRNLNETALFLRPLFGIPKMLYSVVSDYLNGLREEYAYLEAMERRHKELEQRFRETLLSANGSELTRTQVALQEVYGLPLRQDIPVAQLAPVLQLTYTPIPQETLSNGLEGENRGVGGETVDRPAETHYGAFSGMPTPVAPQEPLYYKKGRRYLPVNGVPVLGEKFRKVMKGKTVRYVPA